MGVCEEVRSFENYNLDLDAVLTEKTVRTALEVKVENTPGLKIGYQTCYLKGSIVVNPH